jgi:hypothetical protein
MSVAGDKYALKKRIDRFLWKSRLSRAVELRRLLIDNFMPFERVAIIGGMVRDFARSGRDAFSSDVDLVIDVPAFEIAAFAADLGAVPNRFGGYSWLHGSWKIDFWALETTWASRQGHVNVGKLQDLTSCTFFDWDAVLYDLKTRSIYCDVDYLDRLRRGQLDINLAPTPSVNGNLLRAIRRILLWDIEAGPRLTAFIERHLDEASFNEIAATDRRLYAAAFIEGFRNRRLLLEHVKCKEERTELATFYGRQLPLPGVLGENLADDPAHRSRKARAAA